MQQRGHTTSITRVTLPGQKLILLKSREGRRRRCARYVEALYLYVRTAFDRIINLVSSST